MAWGANDHVDLGANNHVAWESQMRLKDTSISCQENENGMK